MCYLKEFCPFFTITGASILYNFIKKRLQLSILQVIQTDFCCLQL